MPAEPGAVLTGPAPAVPSAPKPRKPLRRWAGVGTAVVIAAVYLLSLAGYFWLDSKAQVLEPRDLRNPVETVVLLEVTGIRPTENAVDARVLVIPEQSLMDPQFGVLNTDMTVRLYPSTDFGELNYPQGRTPAREDTTLFAFGDADRWPFDSFATGTISAEVFVGSGDTRRFVPARVEVAGSLNGWDIRSQRLGPPSGPGQADENATVTFDRSRGPLLLIAGFCLVLLALPALALFVAFETLRGKKAFQPAFGTWFAAMLFAVVPIRGVLPGNPPAGSWIDEAIIVWVLIALTAAMVTFMVAWYRRTD